MTGRSNPGKDAVRIGLELQELTAVVAGQPELREACRRLAERWLQMIADHGMAREAGLIAAALLSSSLIGAIADQRAKETGQDRAQMLRILPQVFGLYQAHTLVEAEVPSREEMGLPPQITH